MSEKTSKIISWIIMGAFALLFVMSAFMKILAGPEIVEQSAALGISPRVFQMIGAIELISIVLFLLPKTGFLGSLLLVAYMGGAIATHLLHGESVLMAVCVQILLWISIMLRYPDIRVKLLLRFIPDQR